MKIGVQSGVVTGRLGIEAGYRAIAEAGFEVIDWNINDAFRSSTAKEGTYRGSCVFEENIGTVSAYFENELNEITKNGLTVSQAHAPFPSYIEGCPDFTDYMIELCRKCIKYCDTIGCRYLVIHGASFFPGTESDTPQDIDEINKKLYSSLIPALEGTNVTVCLENLFKTYKNVPYYGHCSDPEKGAAEIDALNSMLPGEHFGLCLDTGHVNLVHRDMRSFIRTYGKRIKCVHIHDNRGTQDDHLAPLTGNINWGQFCSSLSEVGYDGDLCFETFRQAAVAADFDLRAVSLWLGLIADTGKLLRDRIVESRYILQGT